jgi:hypothetical protein
MTPLTRWTLIITNVLAAIALVALGAMAVSAHRAHAFSTYVELQKQHVLTERPGYDVLKKLTHIAAGGEYSFYIALLGAGASLGNAIAIGCSRNRQQA